MLAQVRRHFCWVGPVGIEPTTFGLKVRRTPFPSVSCDRVLRRNSRAFGSSSPPFMSSYAVLSPHSGLQIGLQVALGPHAL